MNDDEARIDEYLERERARAFSAEDRSWEVAARPDAVPEVTTFSRLRVGDFITADGRRWAKVLALSGWDAVVDVLFEIPEPVTVSGETQYRIERPATAPVTVDANAPVRQ